MNTTDNNGKKELHPTWEALGVTAIWIIVLFIISFLTVCTINYLLKNTAAQEDIDRQRKYFDIDKDFKRRNKNYINNE